LIQLNFYYVIWFSVAKIGKAFAVNVAFGRKRCNTTPVKNDVAKKCNILQYFPHPNQNPPLLAI
jgi:hypothetical protein